MSVLEKLSVIHHRLENCRVCSQMCSPPVHDPALETPVMLIGQAPGAHESHLGRPFAYTAGKTLFQWLNEATGLEEDEIRQRVYIAAVARCFPGPNVKGSGHREPSPEEIANCRPFLRAEVQALQPRVIIAVGKVAIGEVLGPEIFPRGTPLKDVVGKQIEVKFHGHPVQVIPLPHPSGVSRWPKQEPGKSKLKQALRLISKVDFETE